MFICQDKIGGYRTDEQYAKQNDRVPGQGSRISDSVVIHIDEQKAEQRRDKYLKDTEHNLGKMVLDFYVVGRYFKRISVKRRKPGYDKQNCVYPAAYGKKYVQRDLFNGKTPPEKHDVVGDIGGIVLKNTRE